jgi:hypothetical protein
MSQFRDIVRRKTDALRRNVFFCGIVAGVAGLIVGCSSGGTIQEATYVGDMQTSSAVVQATPGGGYRTISGNPIVVVNDQVEPENMLPYGGGEEGIRQAEDEGTPFALHN